MPALGEPAAIYVTEPPWRSEECAVFLRAFQVDRGSAVRPRSGGAIIQSAHGDLTLYSASRSFEWRSRRGAEMHVPDVFDPLSLLNGVSRGYLDALVLDSPGLSLRPYEVEAPFELRAAPPGPAGARPELVRTVTGRALGAAYFVHGVPFWRARLRGDLLPDGRLKALYMFRHDPGEPQQTVMTLERAALASALRCHGIRLDPAAPDPEVGYLMAPPGRRQPLLVPVARLVLTAGTQTVVRYCTAFRCDEARINPALALQPHGGEVLPL